jgi:hypothetical protein
MPPKAAVTLSVGVGRALSAEHVRHGMQAGMRFLIVTCWQHWLRASVLFCHNVSFAAISWSRLFNQHSKTAQAN